ncbi:MAG TPA: tRNA (adenosine(37)-N6)-threonylcarbamoyltransferase complex dimerization subunit type 1 TsaB [Bacteroidales bacterium]|nr:tRNA (adenosine(37)-N6)-threonylcarbamoyltransferase complex dimerization subunit type 1 TsaB [Bacteroidales bacterium]
MILCIETATNICSVALCSNEKVVSARESDEDKSHASLLTILIGELFNESHIMAGQLDAIAISKGPGSFTGLRIGVSVAKGISYASDVPLVAINTLKSMYHGISEIRQNIKGTDEQILFCPMIDARRMDVYYSVFDTGGKELVETRADTIDKNSFQKLLSDHKILFFGNGSTKCRDILRNKNALFHEGFNLSAKYLCIPATTAVSNRMFEDVAYFEPYYLKDFLATIPRKNVFGS